MKNLMESCTICPRECKVNRSLAQVGLCGMSDKIVVARIAPHYFEEPPISGVNGSGAIFFSGCNLYFVKIIIFQLKILERKLVFLN